MKKCKRWIAVILLSAMCLSLCGCQALEDMRAAHAVWQEDGSILWNGNVYRKLANASEKTGILLTQTSIRVTEADVPVLLSETFGEYCRVSSNGSLLVMHGYDGQVLYCREDMYDAMAEHLLNPELTTYYYTYWVYDDVDGMSCEEYYYLSEVQGNTIKRLLTTLDFTAMDEEFFYTFEDNDFIVRFGKCDDERWFSEDDVLEIARNDGTFYLITSDGYIAQVPTEYNDIMKNIVSVYYNEEIAPYL